MYEIYMNIGNYQGKDFSNYEVSNLGNVRNANTKQVLKTRVTTTSTGYQAVIIDLYDTNHKKHTLIVARLVISTFKANSRNCSDVNHINEDPMDNKLNNLKWTTHKENCNYGTRNERAAATKKANGTYDKMAENLKIKVYCVELNRTFDSAKDAADWLDNKQARANITACCKNRQKSAYGYTWCYADDSEGDVK